MNEEEWLVCGDPTQMIVELKYIEGVSERKLRLFACACCRLIWHNLVDARSRAAVEIAEQYADGLVTDDEVTAAGQRAERVNPSDIRLLVQIRRLSPAGQVEFYAAASAGSVARTEDGWPFADHAGDVVSNALEVAKVQTFGPKEEETKVYLVKLIQDIYGPLLFRPSPPLAAPRPLRVPVERGCREATSRGRLRRAAAPLGPPGPATTRGLGRRPGGGGLR